MRVEFFLQDMIDMVNEVDRNLLVGSCNLDKLDRKDI